MGHPSREEGFVLCSNFSAADVLHSGLLPNLISDPPDPGPIPIRLEAIFVRSRR